MPQFYSNPKRETDPHALPDVEVWYHDGQGMAAEFTDEDGEVMETGWYWWFCFPGCMPDSEPNGPFTTEAEALADAQQGSEEEEYTGLDTNIGKDVAAKLDEIRQSDGSLPAYAWPGGYTIVYVMGDGAVCCADCASGKNGSEASPHAIDAAWRVVGYQTHDEGPDEHCIHCNTVLASSYGDPDEGGGGGGEAPDEVRPMPDGQHQRHGLPRDGMS
jgi:hypothetical protein